ncbi:hypothetical protein INS49_005472 [Diaporthe citri]|uniref:uncharacterized protein n=1 Tax=Diaporthe citri TaxID=83186 RepID=UPI001C7FD67B|nr:uncharacterized protein INS49_005472 [Diaporthe citri]KAG6353511.1 hypothetical protein INS49_005472 [Diaporthe citri]
MGMDLMQYPVFRDSVEAADRYLQDQLGCTWSGCEELERGRSTLRLRMPQYSQSLCTVLQVALVELLESWDIRPVAVVGHSSGEIAAAYCQGPISREDAWRVAYFRGVLSAKLKACGIEGSMMAVGISPEGAGEIISKLAPKKVHVACVNSPGSVTLSGDAEAIDMVYDALRERGIFVRKLQVDVAYHSPHMQLVARGCWETIADVSTNFSPGKCSMYSSVTGELVQPGGLVSACWVKNLISPVQFATAVQQLATKEKALDLLVEVGPHATLQGPSTQSLQNIDISDLPYHSVLLRNQNGVETALNLAGSLSAQGYLTWLNRDTSRNYVSIKISVFPAINQYTSGLQVRTCMFGGEHMSVQSQYLAVTGQVELPRHVYEPARKLGTAAVIGNTQDTRCLFGLLSKAPDRSSAVFYWVLGIRSDDPAGEAAWLGKASQEELYDKAADLTEGWPSVLRDIIEHTGPAGMFTPPINFFEFVPPDKLPGKRVTLLGDAAHAMIPFRGGGANTAIRDACELAELIIQAHQEVGVLVPYEEVMLPRGRDIVLASRAAGESIEKMYQAVRAAGHFGGAPPPKTKQY